MVNNGHSRAHGNASSFGHPTGHEDMLRTPLNTVTQN